MDYRPSLADAVLALPRFRFTKDIDRRIHNAINAAAKKFEPNLRSAFLAAVKSAKSKVTIDAIEAALQSGNPAAAIRATSAGLEFATMKETLAQLVEAGGIIGTRSLAAKGIIAASFDVTNPYAVNYARQGAAGMVQQITTSVQEGIRNAIERSFTEGIPPRTIAREIKSMIGLTKYQTNVVLNYQSRLIADDAANVEAKTMAYADKVLRRRALAIARTETMDAANFGNQASWLAAKDQGLISAATEQVWIVAKDPRLCELCEAMPTMPENQHVQIGGLFTTPEGERIIGPTLHPLCRCTTALKL